MLDKKMTQDKYGYLVDDLPLGSHKNVCVVCDYCNVKYEKIYKARNHANTIIDKDACQKCRFKKREEISLKRDGVKNSAQRSDVKAKLSDIDWTIYHNDIVNLHEKGYSTANMASKLQLPHTSLYRYIQSINLETRGDIKNKKEKTSIERYGEDYKQEFTERSKKVVMDKYGVENVFCIKDMVKQGMLQKYGVEHPSQHPESQKKQKESEMKTKIERGQVRIHKGLTVNQWAEKIGYCKSRFHVLVTKYGFDLAVKMTPKISSLEVIVSNFLNEQNIKYIRHFAVKNYYSDLYLPDYKIIIETDGLYWHSEAVQPDYLYHVKKRQAYIDAGYTPLFFREDEIENKFEIVKSIILNKLGKSQKIGARQCEIKEIDRGIGYNFICANHLMGATMQGRYFGLMYSGELICLLCILRRQGDEYEISRFCPKIGYQIVGGFSKLIKFAQQHISMKKLITFIDLRYGTGDYLTNLGFKQTSCHPSFRWTNGSESFHRLRYTGNTGYEAGNLKAWDCGQAKWCIIP